MSTHQINCWAVYDATGEKQFIKMNDNGCLALFDTEEGAAAAVRANPGTAYKKVTLYLRPHPVPEVALLEAFDAGRRAAQADADGLAEALEAVMEFGCDPKSNRGIWALKKAESALAAYRNQGDEA